MSKKIIEDALISAKDLEEAVLENAKDVVIEQVLPSLKDYFSDILTEGKNEEDDEDEFDVDKEEMTSGSTDGEDAEEFKKEKEEEEEEDMKEGTEHDIGKEEDAGRDDTDAATAGVDEVEDVTEDISEADLVEEEIDLVIEDDAIELDEAKKKTKKESDEKKGELEIPDELFDEPEEKSSDKGDGNGNLKLQDKMEDDDSEDDEDEKSPDKKDEQVSESDSPVNEGVEEDSCDEIILEVSDEEDDNLGRIQELEKALSATKTQLHEANVFNAKLAYVNKLYNSGLFNNAEKESIVERMDKCGEVDEIKSLYKTIVNEVKDKNPLDDFSNLIKEQRVTANAKTEKIFESPEMLKMKRLAGIED